MRYLFFICVIVLAAFLYNNPQTRNAYHHRAHDVYGIDVAHYQENIDWQKVEGDNISFAFVKATEGETHVDSHFHKNWSELARTSIKRGVYHFFRPSIDAQKQAIHFIRTVKLKPGDLPPVLDIEVTDNRTHEDVVKGVAVWLDMVEKHYGVRPIIYSGLNFHKKYLANSFPNHYVWIASYGWRSPQLANRQPWTFWQYTDKGNVKGIAKAVDINAFNGNFFALNRLGVPDPNNPFSPQMNIPGQNPQIDLGDVLKLGKQLLSPHSIQPSQPLSQTGSASGSVNDTLNNPAGIVTKPLSP